MAGKSSLEEPDWMDWNLEYCSNADKNPFFFLIISYFSLKNKVTVIETKFESVIRGKIKLSRIKIWKQKIKRAVKIWKPRGRERLNELHQTAKLESVKRMGIFDGTHRILKIESVEKWKDINYSCRPLKIESVEKMERLQWFVSTFKKLKHWERENLNEW